PYVLHPIFFYFFILFISPPPSFTLFPYTTLFRSAPSQPNAVYMMNGGNMGQPDTNAFVALVSPLVQVGAEGATLKFYCTGNFPIIIGNMSDPSDTSTFTPLQQISLTPDWVQHTIFLTEPGNTYLVF